MAYVYPIRNLLSVDLVRSLRAALNDDSAPWVDGAGTAGGDHFKKQNQEIDPSSQLRSDLSKRIEAALSYPLSPQATALRIYAEPSRQTPFLFSRTRPGDGYRDHMDSIIMGHGSDREVRADLSMTIFLSDPNEYEGGELVIDSDMPSALIYKMAAGGAVLYATTAIHRVNPVRSGERLAAFTWIESRIPDPSIRQLHADLSEALALLKGQHGEDPKVREQAITKIEKARANLAKRSMAVSG